MKLLTLLTLISLNAFTCELVTSSVIIKLTKSLDDSIIKSSDCDAKTKANFVNTISSIEGTVNARSLFSILDNNNIDLKPKKIEVKSLLNFIYSVYDEKTYRVTNLNSISSKTALLVDSISNLKLNCKECKDSGFNNFKLTHKQESIWLSAMFIMATDVVVLKNDFKNLGGSLTSNDITVKKVFTKNKQNLFFDHKNIEHYKINKFISKGHILKRYDLTATNLITLGKTVDLIIETDNLALKTKATARQSGPFGSTIELINLKTKKKIMAEVTGPNQATLRL